MLQKESISAENKVFWSSPVLSALFVPFWFWQKLATSPLALSVSAETLSSISNLLFVSFHMLFQSLSNQNHLCPSILRSEPPSHLGVISAPWSRGRMFLLSFG